MRVVERAKTLQVAVWLHRLDMSVQGNEVALETLDTSLHCLGYLLESFLVPPTHGLSFREVVAWCLYENRHDSQCWLDDLVTCRDRVWEELGGLMEAHRMATGATRRWAKKDMDLHHRDLETLKACISYEESHLREDSPKGNVQDNLPHKDAETEMSPEAGANDAPPEDALAPVPGFPPREDPTMEVYEGAVGPPSTSPVSRDDDDLLSGNAAAGVEADLAHLTISSPSGQERWRERKPNAQRHLPLWRKFNCRTDSHS